MKNLVKKHILGICLALFVIGAIMFSEMYHPGGTQSVKTPAPSGGIRHTDEAGLVQYDGEFSESSNREAEKGTTTDVVTSVVDSVPCHCPGDPKVVAERIRRNREAIEYDRHRYGYDGWQPYVSPCGWIRFEYVFGSDIR